MPIPHVKSECKMGIAMQTTFGTAIADNAAVTQLICELTEMDPGVVAEKNNSAQGTREEVLANYDVRTDLQLAKTSLKMDVNLNAADIFLVLFRQYCVEAASTPFGKTIRRHATQPDFESSAGFFATLFEYDPVAPRKTRDVIAESLKLDYQSGKNLSMEVGLVSRYNPEACTPSGTWTPIPTGSLGSSSGTSPMVRYFDRFTLDFGSGDVSPVLTGFTLDAKSKVFQRGTSAGPRCQGYGVDQWLGDLTIKMEKDTNAVTAFADLIAGTAISGRIGKGNATAGSVVGDFDIVFSGYLTKTPTDFSSDALGIELKIKILGEDASTPGDIITLANAIDRGW